MRAEVGFVAGYATVLLLVALGLHRLGRAAAGPVWRSRMLAGYRRQATAADPLPDTAVHQTRYRTGGDGYGTGRSAPRASGAGSPRDDAPEAGAPWPHNDASRLYTGIGLVATAAALLLVGVEAARHHRPIETVVLAVVGGATITVIGALTGRLRHGGVPY